MRRALVVAAALMGCTCAPGPGAGSGPGTGSDPGHVPPPPPPASAADAVRVGDVALPVTVLRADPARARGWAGLERLPADAGLLRVWPRSLYVALGNGGYRVETAVAFVAADGAVVSLGAIRPDQGFRDPDGPWVKSPAPVRFVLEVAPGWLAAHGVKAGARLAIPPALAAGAEEPRWPALPRGTVRVGDHAVGVEIAATREHRTRGLMFRTDLPPDTGMLFVYREPKRLGFWMKNCCLSLTVAYLADDGRIAGLVDMAPAWAAPPTLVLPTYDAPEAVALALEMPQGWFAARGIRVGHRVTLPDEIADWRRRAEP